MDEVLIASVLASSVRLATPLILCALAGMFAERSGVVDIGLEGKMLFAAFAAGAAGATSGSWMLALVAAMAVGVALSMVPIWAGGRIAPERAPRRPPCKRSADHAKCPASSNRWAA